MVFDVSIQTKNDKIGGFIFGDGEKMTIFNNVSF
jgi:hypothetical protein